MPTAVATRNASCQERGGDDVILDVERLREHLPHIHVREVLQVPEDLCIVELHELLVARLEDGQADVNMQLLRRGPGRSR